MFKEILTSPELHDPNNFIYIVYGLINYTGQDYDGSQDTDPKFIADKVIKITDKDYFYCASLVSHLEIQAAKKIGYSGRVNQLDTYGNVGFIINPGSEDLIYIASNCDIGSGCTPGRLDRFANTHKGKIKTPHELLTNSFGINELIIRGSIDTAIQAVFYNFSPENKFGDPEDKGKRIAEIVSEILQKNTPLIKLPDQPYYTEERRKLCLEYAKRELLDKFI